MTDGEPFAVSICHCRACQRPQLHELGAHVEAREREQGSGPELADPVRSLYDAGRYAEAADRGRELLAAHPGDGRLIYNLACCESVAGRTDDAIAHLRQAISISGDFRAMATRDADFDPLRGEPAFIRLIEG